MQVIRNMSVTVKRDEALAKLRANKEQHAAIVREARDGYIKRAQIELEKRLAWIKEGKIKNLVFTLSPPQDYTAVYQTAIEMLSMHTEETIELDSEQFRSLIQNNWDWMTGFLNASAMYSKTASDLVGASYED